MEKVTFANLEGEKLTGILELPVNQAPHTFALFAHCFTCSKNLNAIRNISRTLNQAGIAVLSFDFTGLGESEGEFAETNFSSNVQDLITAAGFLEENYSAPTMLIGHSLGGAAVVSASASLESIKAIVTIGAPFDPGHVSHLLKEKEEEIKENGKATVEIAGRSFSIKKQFLEDIESQKLEDILHNSRIALLIMHSPQDEIVEIENARKIYTSAFHPKSFISLDGANHLLTNKDDAVYVGETIAAWSKRYISIPKQKEIEPPKEVSVRLGSKGFTTEVMVRHHQLVADEPESVGGNDLGPSPYELVSSGLGTCTAMTLQMYARRKKWDLKEVVVHVEHYKDYTEDMMEPDKPANKIDIFNRVIEVEGDLDADQKLKLLEIANKCPVHKTLEGNIEVKTRME
jgi:putative redox protein